MKNLKSLLPSTRREFLGRGLKGLGLVAFSRFAPQFLTQSVLGGAPMPEKDRTILVLIQLAGGNDGLNTLIPHGNDDYYRLRPNLGIRAREAIRIDDQFSFHPGMSPFKALLDRGQLAVVQNVGYPNPNRSHFRSGEIWETAADSDTVLSSGWVGRIFDNNCSGPHEAPGPVGIHLTTELPQAFTGEGPHETFGLSPKGLSGRRRSAAVTMDRTLIDGVPDAKDDNLGFLKHTMLDAIITEERIRGILTGDRANARYPNSGLSRSLKSIAAMIQAGLPTRVYFASLGGFDTHSNQAGTHDSLLQTLSASMQAFQQDLDKRGLADQVLTMTFSEFGRRPAENNGRGTDHGTAAPLFVMGSRIQGGILGTPPDLNIGPKDDLRFSTDFRGVYTQILDRWLECPSESVLGAQFEAPGFL